MTARPAQPDVWVQFTETIEPTRHDRTRYDAHSVWAVRPEKAAQLVAAGVAVLTDPPAAALREVTEPLEPPPVDETDEAPAVPVDEEE